MNFYDTSSLLLMTDEQFKKEQFAISNITLQELEAIKVSANKDPEVKKQARHLLYLLDQHDDNYHIEYFFDNLLDDYRGQWVIDNDLKILLCADAYAKLVKDTKSVYFVTNDIAQKMLAKLFPTFARVESLEEEKDEYCGYKKIYLSDEELEEFYSDPTKNTYNLLINEYVLVYNRAEELVDRLCWTGEEYRHLNYSNFNSKWFGEIKPLKGDIYQSLAADSLTNNKITMLKGPAGSGKTLLSLSFLLNRLDKGKIDKIIIFCNTIATKNSAKLGFYPGTRDEKLLDSQIGNLLSSKFGGKYEVERMIDQEKLILLPMSDIRGYDTSGMRAGIYISEAQNLDITLMKLALQRIGEDSICIIDGDEKTQVDDSSFAGANNGMRRASKVFRGTDVYGEVELRNIHRSKIAQLAENM